MFKQLTISNFKQSISDISQNHIIVKMKSIIHWLIVRIMMSINLLLILFGLVFVFGMSTGLFVFNPSITTNNAVVFYRSNLPHTLTKKEAKQVSELKILSAKLNKESKIYANKINIITATKNKKELSKDF